MESEPYQSPKEMPPVAKPEGTSAERAAYNVVSDTVGGLNVRKSDNRFQAYFIGVSVLLFAVVGAAVAFFNPRWELPWFGGALIGSFAGLVCGFFASGIWLMIYRGIQHLRGNHE